MQVSDLILCHFNGKPFQSLTGHKAATHSMHMLFTAQRNLNLFHVGLLEAMDNLTESEDDRKKAHHLGLLTALTEKIDEALKAELNQIANAQLEKQS